MEASCADSAESRARMCRSIWQVSGCQAKFRDTSAPAGRGEVVVVVVKELLW